MTNEQSIPIIDISSLVGGNDDAQNALKLVGENGDAENVARLIGKNDDARDAARQIREACCEHGFFYVINHGVSEELQERLENLSREFFALDLETKMKIRMELGGRAWRGYFPVGVEYTSGKPDKKEGIYFGEELDPSHPKVLSKVPMHGQNLFPELPGFRETVLRYLDEMVSLGHSLMRGIALSLGLDASYFVERYTRDPLILFRIFHYPPVEVVAKNSDQEWSVGEHTDYGILTILRQDNVAGLQVKSRAKWIDAPPIPNSFICNIGDMLDRMTGGLYRSTPHRVLNKSGVSRLSFPFFFDPNFDVEVKAIDPSATIFEDKSDRWDRASVHEFSGTYGDYVLNKVSKVFPALSRETL